MEKAKRTLKIVLNVFIWIFVVFAIFITVLVISAQNSADGVPEIGGKCVINILSDSMSPTIKSGDIIIGRKLSESEKQNLKKDDVITFYADLNGDGKTELNTHRIKEVNLSSSSSVISYTTNGDNNLAEDTEAVTTDRIISIWTEKIGRVGSVIGFLQTSTGFLVVIVIPLILFFAYEMYRFIKTLISVKNSGKKQITEADEEEIKRRAVEEYLKQQEETNQQQDTGEDANT